MTMNRYPSYKPTGVKWLGEIPSHWEVKHLRNFLTLFSEKGYGNSQLLSVTREKGVILRDKENKEENHNFVPDDLSGYKHLEAGDFVINKMKSWQGSYGVSDYEGIVSPAYFTCKLHGVNPQFFSCAIRSKAYVGFFMQYSKGIRVDQWDLDPSSMKDIPFVLPSPEEQSAIATYLDTATAKIDAAIAQQQKMIDLLNERKQIIINRAVTKGLNPNAKMKDSGVEWIGEVPEGWEVRKLGHCIDILPGYAFSSQDFAENGIKLLRGINVTPEKLRWEDSVYWNKTIDNSLNKYLLKEDDLVLGLDRPWIGSGTRVVLVNKEDLPCLLVQRVCRIRPTNKMSIKFVYYLLSNNLFYNALSVDTTGVSVPHISTEQIKKVVMPIPGLSEQNSIVEYIEIHIASINKAIQAANKQISLLQERKQIIINEVVTGKVKVV